MITIVKSRNNKIYISYAPAPDRHARLLQLSWDRCVILKWSRLRIH